MNGETIVVRAGRHVYIVLLIALGWMPPLGIAAMVSDLVETGSVSMHAIQVLMLCVGFPGLAFLLVWAMYVTITEDRVSCWQVGYWGSIRLADVKRAVEDRWGSSGTIYVRAGAHALVLLPRNADGRELVINLKPFRDEDIERLFTALRERGIPVRRR